MTIKGGRKRGYKPTGSGQACQRKAYAKHLRESAVAGIGYDANGMPIKSIGPDASTINGRSIYYGSKLQYKGE